MLYLVIFITFLLLVLLFIYLVKVNVILEYKLNGLDDRLIVNFTIFNGLYVYNYNKKDNENKKPVDPENKLSGFNTLNNKIDNLKYIYGLVKRIKVLLREKLILREFKLKIDVGTGDAYYTGILSGVLWAIAGSITAILANTFRNYKKTVKIKPNFSETKFTVELYCIFSVKIVHIIIVAVKLYLDKKLNRQKTKGGEVSG